MFERLAMKHFPFFRVFLVSLIVAALVFYGGQRLLPSSAAPAKETRWEQVMKRGTLRCGYFMWPPFLERENGSGKVTGPIADIIEKMASNLSLKVDWVSEVDVAHAFLNYDRFDMICAPFTQNGLRARVSDFSIPLGYGGAYVWVREGDHRFDGALDALNDPAVKIAIMDGEMSDLLSQELFPKAQRVAMSQVGAGGQLIMEVVDGKADATITDAFSMALFQMSNPGKIKAASMTPVRVTNFSFPLPPNEYSFKNAVDIALREMVETGLIDRLLRPYEQGMARILRPAKLYQE